MRALDFSRLFFLIFAAVAFVFMLILDWRLTGTFGESFLNGLSSEAV
jgi:hypothetical protein